MADRRVQYQSIPDSDEEGHQDTTPPVTYSPRGRFNCFCVLLVLFLVLLAISMTVLTVLLLVVGRQPPRVTTTCGDVEGLFDPPTRVFIFRGIPFAAPPTGERRWSRPLGMSMENKTCWAGLLKAQEFRDACAQWDPDTDSMIGSEDCLYLNIFTPSLEPLDGSLPVMVYIHGGGLQTGSSSSTGSTPDAAIAAKLNVIFVSVQYRLGPLGFLVMDQLPGNGNYGFWDQIEALKWVKGNIRSFGGDPARVTLFGQGSGATSSLALMTSPEARVFFQKVWLLSPGTLINTTLSEARSSNSFLNNETDINKHCTNKVVTRECLYKVPLTDLLRAVRKTWPTGSIAMDMPTKNVYDISLPVIDGVLLPDSPDNLLRSKSGSDVPVIIGSTAQEMDYLPTPYTQHSKNFKDWDKGRYYKYLSSHLDGFGDDVGSNHSRSITNTTAVLYRFTDATSTFANTVTDVKVTCGVNTIARLASEAFTSPVYRYVITARPSRPVTIASRTSGVPPWHATLSFSTLDIFAFFDGFGVLFSGNAPQTKDVTFSDNLQREIMQFVFNGTVRTTAWKPFPNATALIAEKTEVRTAHTPIVGPVYHGNRCAFWERNGFSSYSWNY